jgi:hypothetical protein
MSIGLFLTNSGKKFVEKELQKHNEELRELLTIKKNNSRDEVQHDERTSRDNLIVIQNKILECEKKLSLPVKKIWEQNKKILHGNGTEVLLNGTPYYLVMDGVCVTKHKLPPNHAIVGSNTPLGIALNGKKVGDEGRYMAGEMAIYFKVKKIDFPSKAKWIFKYDEKMVSELTTV